MVKNNQYNNDLGKNLLIVFKSKSNIFVRFDPRDNDEF